MMTDIGTVFWKEQKELLSQKGTRGRLGVLMFVLVFGIFLPLEMGRSWIESPMVLLYWVWVPLFLVSTVIADAFAGERERHTLETLLASRLPDRAILLGKMFGGIGYSWGLTLLSLVLGLVTVNLTHGDGTMLMFSPLVGLAILVLSLLGAGLAAGTGVVVSLRASTVRQAQQTLSVSILMLLFVPVLGAQALPLRWKVSLVQLFAEMGVTTSVIGAIFALVLVNLGLFLWALARFKRARLILD
ncbi:MAG TPA: ABC transporter permease [Bacteroidota bacterium]|jgi:ABC-2 type transport system permease protein|nr:ABC transporter permease [Bacteroidota bacterium]